MLSGKGFRIAFFVFHGVLALAAGVSLLYLQVLISNPFFEAVAVIIALVLCGAAITLAGIADWFAAFGSGLRNVAQVVLYVLAGAAFITAGSFLAFSSQASLQILLVLTMVHGAVFGSVAMTGSFRLNHRRVDQAIIATFGILSILISGVLASKLWSMQDRTALIWIGAYLCLVAAKLFFFAGDERYHSLHPGPAPSAATVEKRSTHTSL